MTELDGSEESKKMKKSSGWSRNGFAGGNRDRSPGSSPAGRVSVILLLLLLWEFGARLSGVSPLLFPPVSRVAVKLLQDLYEGSLPGRIGFSLLIIFEGVLFGCLGAFVLSLGGSFVRPLRQAVDTLVALMHPLPGIALLPLVILWAGTGRTAVLLIIIHSVVWPLTTNMVAGIRAIPAHLYDVGRNFRLSLPELTLHLVLPATLPHLISGLRIGWARAWRALIAAEMVFGAAGGSGGLGWYLFRKRVFMDTEGLFAGILVIMLIGVLFEEFLFEALERRTVGRWGGR